MALKVFTPGERLFAADLNDNFDFLEAAVDNAGPAFDTAGSDTVNLNFDKERILTRAAAGAVTFTGSNYTAGRSVTVRVVAGASSRDLTFPADWKFVSFKPATLAANKTGVLAVTAFGSSAAECVAAWAAEA